MEELTLEEIVRNLESLKKGKGEEWVVKHDGMVLTMPSGKSVWKKKNHAASAFSNYANYKYPWRPLDKFKKSLGIEGTLGQYLIKEGIVTIEKL